MRLHINPAELAEKKKYIYIFFQFAILDEFR